MEVMNNWMDHRVASIWYKISGSGYKTLYLGGVYREHTILNQPEVMNSEQHQFSRWKLFIDQWKLANSLSDCVVIGDINLDMLRWDSPVQINIGMTDLVKMEIEAEGSVQLVEGPTRFWPHQRDSLIDHIWTNCPQKVCFPRSRNPWPRQLNCPNQWFSGQPKPLPPIATALDSVYSVG